jgi:hypothetical protein
LTLNALFFYFGALRTFGFFFPTETGATRLALGIILPIDLMGLIGAIDPMGLIGANGGTQGKLPIG